MLRWQWLRRRFDKISRTVSHSQRGRKKQSRTAFFEPLESRLVLNGMPIAKDDLQYFTAVDTALVIGTSDQPLMQNDWDPEGSSITASVVTNPSNGSLSGFSGSAGTFTYTPNSSYSGLDSFTYKVNDGTSDSETVTVAIAVGGHFGPRTNLEEMPHVVIEAPLTSTMPSGCSANSTPIRYEASCLTGDLQLVLIVTK